jgi:hypothetical protein
MSVCGTILDSGLQVLCFDMNLSQISDDLCLQSVLYTLGLVILQKCPRKEHSNYNTIYHIYRVQRTPTEFFAFQMVK